MRTTSFTAIMIACLLTAFMGCRQIPKPENKGKGPLAVIIDRGTATAEYHSPLERWRAVHKKALQNGDFTEKECVLCHNPRKSCNNCHEYIGAQRVVIPEAELYWPAEGINRPGEKEN
jgi:hypothetical protein